MRRAAAPLIALGLTAAVTGAASAATPFTHPPRLAHLAVRCMTEGAMENRVRIAYAVAYGDVLRSARWQRRDHRVRATLALRDPRGRTVFRHTAERTLPKGLPGSHVHAVFHMTAGPRSSRRLLSAAHHRTTCAEQASGRELRATLTAGQRLASSGGPPRATAAQATTATTTTTTGIDPTDWTGLKGPTASYSAGQGARVKALTLGDFNSDNREDIAHIAIPNDLLDGVAAVSTQDAKGAFPATGRSTVVATQRDLFTAFFADALLLVADTFTAGDSYADLAVLTSVTPRYGDCAGDCGPSTWLGVYVLNGSKDPTTPVAAVDSINPDAGTGKFYSLMSDPPSQIRFDGLFSSKVTTAHSTPDLVLGATRYYHDADGRPVAGDVPVLLSVLLSGQSTALTFSGSKRELVFSPGLEAAVVVPTEAAGAAQTDSVAVLHAAAGGLGLTYDLNSDGSWRNGIVNAQNVGGTTPRTAVSGDFDNDGANDVAVASPAGGGTGARLAILYNGSGAGQPLTAWRFVGNQLVDLSALTPPVAAPVMATADVDGDGCEDIVVADRAGGGVHVLRPRCDGSLLLWPDAEVFDAGSTGVGALAAGQVHQATQPADVVVAAGDKVSVLDGQGVTLEFLTVAAADVQSAHSLDPDDDNSWDTDTNWVLTGTLSTFSLDPFAGRTGFTQALMGDFVNKTYLTATSITEPTSCEQAYADHPGALTPADAIAMAPSSLAAAGTVTLIGRFDDWISDATGDTYAVGAAKVTTCRDSSDAG